MDLATFANFALSGAVGALSSWLISAYYFNKSSRAEKVVSQVKYALQHTLIPLLYPSFFDNFHSDTIYPSQSQPANTDIPHVEFARINRRNVRQGDAAEFLLKLADSGFDLDNPNGISVRDHAGVAVGVHAVGLGYCRFTINIRETLAPGPYFVTVELADDGDHTKSKPNRNIQTLQFSVHPRGDE